MEEFEEVHSKKTLSVIVNPDGSLRDPSKDEESRSMGFNMASGTLKEFLDSPVLNDSQRTALCEIFAYEGHKQVEYHADIGKEDRFRHLHFIFKPTTNGTYFSIVDDTERTLANRETRNYARERDLVAKLMRHDVKPPLVKIGGLANLGLSQIEAYNESAQLGENPCPEKLITDLQGYLEIIDASGNDMEEIMHNLTMLGEVDKKPLDMYDDVVRLRIENARRYLKHTHKEIKLDREQSMKSGQAFLRADKIRCQAVYRNLINNAIKHMPGASRVCCGVCDLGHFYRFNVYNEGPVIPPTIINKMFDEGVAGGEHAGSGLGLYVARTYVREQGGDMWAEKDRKEGANIIFDLPKE